MATAWSRSPSASAAAPRQCAPSWPARVNRFDRHSRNTRLFPMSVNNGTSMNPPDDSRDDRHWPSFLGAVDRSAAPPDRAFLERLRAQSTEVFLASSFQQAQRQRRRHMATVILRWSAAAAAVILVGAFFFSWFSPQGREVDFGKVLD